MFKSSAEARAAAHRSWANTVNRRGRTQAARDASWASVLAKVDPDGAMSAKDRAKAIENARQAHINRMVSNALQGCGAGAGRRRASIPAPAARRPDKGQPVAYPLHVPPGFNFIYIQGENEVLEPPKPPVGGPGRTAKV